MRTLENPAMNPAGIPDVRSAAEPGPHLTHLACRGRCHADPGRRTHHDQLLCVETDHEAMLEFFELAVTWNELQYPPDMIPPEQWLDFAQRHRWRDPAHVLRVFSLATDIARTSRPAGRTVSAAAR